MIIIIVFVVVFIVIIIHIVDTFMITTIISSVIRIITIKYRLINGGNNSISLPLGNNDNPIAINVILEDIGKYIRPTHRELMILTAASKTTHVNISWWLR